MSADNCTTRRSRSVATMKKILAVAALATTVTSVSARSTEVTPDDPAVAVYEYVIKSRLKSPTSYKRVGKPVVGKNMALVRYDAANEFNATIRDMTFCYFRIDQNGMWRLKSDNPLDIDAAFDSGAQPIPQSATGLGVGD